MKPKEYIKKYNLENSTKFNTNDFINDLKIDFDNELNKCNGLKSLKGYDQCIRVLRSKWDAINRKTANVLSEKLWKYLYASYVAKMRDEFFADEMGKRREESARRKQEYEDRKSFYEREFGQDHFKEYFSNFIDRFFSPSVPEESFKILGFVNKTTKDKVIESFRKLSKIHHPDKGGNHKKFIAICEAKEDCLRYLEKSEVV